MKSVFARIAATAKELGQWEQCLNIVIFIFLAGFLVSCSASLPSSEKVSGDIKVLAPIADTKNSSESKYILGFVELLGIKDLQELSGRFVRFFFSPRISNGRLDGDNPRARFIRNSDGIFVPSNDLSQQMAVIYSHMQKLAQLDEELGAGGINKWPRDVGVGVRVGGGLKNNAFYDGKTDSMLFVPYTQSALPIAINGGILAHEHFHSLFYKIVAIGIDQPTMVHDRDSFLESAGITDQDGRRARSGSDNSKSSSNTAANDVSNTDETSIHRKYHSVILRGMNEGLADFWGWMYSGNPDFIAASLPNEKKARSMSVTVQEEALKLPKTITIKRAISIYISYSNNISVGEYLNSYAYSVGTQFSRMLKAFSDVSAEARGSEALQARKEVARWLIKTLPRLRSDLLGIGEKNYYSSTQFVDAFASAVSEMNEKECQYLLKVRNNSSDNPSKMICKKNDIAWKIVAE